MTVTFDAVGPSSAGATLATGATLTLTWTHVCGASANCLIVGIALGANSTAKHNATLTVTYNGVAMTGIPKVASAATTAGYIQQFYLMNPTTGSHSVTATLSTAVTGLSAGSISLAGVVSLGTPVAAAGDATSSGAGVQTATVTGTSIGNMVVAAACAGSNGVTVASPATLQWARFTNGSSGGGAGGAETTPSLSGSTPIGFTLPADFWGISAVEVQGAVAAVVNSGQFFPFFM